MIKTPADLHWMPGPLPAPETVTSGVQVLIWYSCTLDRKEAPDGALIRSAGTLEGFMVLQPMERPYTVGIYDWVDSDYFRFSYIFFEIDWWAVISTHEGSIYKSGAEVVQERVLESQE